MICVRSIDGRASLLLLWLPCECGEWCVGSAIEAPVIFCGEDDTRGAPFCLLVMVADGVDIP